MSFILRLIPKCLRTIPKFLLKYFQKSESVSPAYNIVTIAPPVARAILKNFSAKELNRFSRVCKLWSLVTEDIKKLRRMNILSFRNKERTHILLVDKIRAITERFSEFPYFVCAVIAVFSLSIPVYTVMLFMFLWDEFSNFIFHYDFLYFVKPLVFIQRILNKYFKNFKPITNADVYIYLTSTLKNTFCEPTLVLMFEDSSMYWYFQTLTLANNNGLPRFLNYGTTNTSSGVGMLRPMLPKNCRLFSIGGAVCYGPPINGEGSDKAGLSALLLAASPKAQIENFLIPGTLRENLDPEPLSDEELLNLIPDITNVKAVLLITKYIESTEHLKMNNIARALLRKHQGQIALVGAVVVELVIPDKKPGSFPILGITFSGDHVSAASVGFERDFSEEEFEDALNNLQCSSPGESSSNSFCLAFGFFDFTKSLRNIYNNIFPNTPLLGVSSSAISNTFLPGLNCSSGRSEELMATITNSWAALLFVTICK